MQSCGPGDGNDFRKAEAIADGHTAFQLSEPERERALEHFRQDRMVEEHLLLYSTVCQERS